MTKVEPFYRQRPITSATTTNYQWCMLWLDSWGNVRMIEWLD